MAAKSNEITVVPALLRVLELAGGIVTVDAMGCQKTIAKEIWAADADYVLTLKGNHEAVHAEVKTYLDDAVARAAATLAALETVEKDYGRHETRRYYHSTDMGWFSKISELAPSEVFIGSLRICLPSFLKRA